MDKIPLHTFTYLKEIRKQLRSNLTSAEALLWQCLKNKRLGNKKFRRQHSILNYIVDFYCAEEKLIIELDGAHHFTTNGAERDYERDTALSSLGFRILRFENELVMKNCEAVLITIESYFDNLSQPLL